MRHNQQINPVFHSTNVGHDTAFERKWGLLAFDVWWDVRGKEIVNPLGRFSVRSRAKMAKCLFLLTGRYMWCSERRKREVSYCCGVSSSESHVGRERLFLSFSILISEWRLQSELCRESACVWVMTLIWTSVLLDSTKIKVFLNLSTNRLDTWGPK